MCLFLDPTCSIVVIKIAAMLSTNSVHLGIVIEALITDRLVISQTYRESILAQVYIETYYVSAG